MELARSISEKTGIGSGALISAVESVSRHPFLPENRVSSAYEDRTLPLGRGKFIPSPSDIVSLLFFSKLNPSDRVLIIGDSVGYTAALVQKVAAQITILEIDSASLEKEKEYFLPSLETDFPGNSDGDDNLAILSFDDLASLRRSDPFSLIIILASTDDVPGVIFGLLGPGGRICGSLRGMSGFSILFRYEKNSAGGRIETGKEVYLPYLEKWP